MIEAPASHAIFSPLVRRAMRMRMRMTVRVSKATKEASSAIPTKLKIRASR